MTDSISSLELLSNYLGFALFLWRRSLETLPATGDVKGKRQQFVLSVLIPHSYMMVVVVIIVASPYRRRNFLRVTQLLLRGRMLFGILSQS